MFNVFVRTIQDPYQQSTFVFSAKILKAEAAVFFFWRWQNLIRAFMTSRQNTTAEKSTIRLDWIHLATPSDRWSLPHIWIVEHCK